MRTRKGEKDIFRLVKLRDKTSKNLNHLRYIKNKDKRVLVKNCEIERWSTYFEKLLNKDQFRGYSCKEINDSSRQINYHYIQHIRFSKIEDALKKIRVGKALGPDRITIKI